MNIKVQIYSPFKNCIKDLGFIIFKDGLAFKANPMPFTFFILDTCSIWLFQEQKLNFFVADFTFHKNHIKE